MRNTGASGESASARFEALRPTPSDLVAVSRYRRERLQRELARHDVAGVLLYNPVNIRYGTGSRNMQVWHLHNPWRHALVFTNGPTIMFEFPGSEHLLKRPEVLIDEVAAPIGYSYMFFHKRVAHNSRAWAARVADLVRSYGGTNRRLAVDRVDLAGLVALQGAGLAIEDGQGLMETARAIKSADELKIIRWAIAGAELALDSMHEALQPGMTEQALWSHMHQRGIELGGEWFETRLLSSGPGTNPWYQECGERVIRAGDLVAFDTDFVGPGGYYVDISRTWRCGDRRPSDAQRRLYADAYQALQRQIDLLRPGMSFREYSERVGPVPDRYAANRYTVLAHGVGVAEEYPTVPFEQDLETFGSDGRFEENMTVCIELYAGEQNGREGVKLEEQVLIAKTGVERLSQYPYEEDWL